MFLQTWAQAYLAATRAAVVMTMEPVAAAGFAVAFGEALTLRIVIGGALVLAAMYVVELVPGRSARPRSHRPARCCTTRSRPRRAAGRRTSAACVAPPGSTSRWVTSRAERGPSTEIRTPLSAAAAASAGGVEPVAGQVQRDDVGRGVDRVHHVRSGLVARHGEQVRVLVVLGQPLDVVLDREKPGSSEDPGLAHAGAVPLAPDPGLGVPARPT